MVKLQLKNELESGGRKKKSRKIKAKKKVPLKPKVTKSLKDIDKLLKVPLVKTDDFNIAKLLKDPSPESSEEAISKLITQLDIKKDVKPEQISKLLKTEKMKDIKFVKKELSKIPETVTKEDIKSIKEDIRKLPEDIKDIDVDDIIDVIIGAKDVSQADLRKIGRISDSKQTDPPGCSRTLVHPFLNFCGPGNCMSGDPPVNDVDNCCMIHDFDYIAAETPQDIRRADEKLLRCLEKFKDQFGYTFSRAGIKAKIDFENKLEDEGKGEEFFKSINALGYFGKAENGKPKEELKEEPKEIVKKEEPKEIVEEPKEVIEETKEVIEEPMNGGKRHNTFLQTCSILHKKPKYKNIPWKDFVKICGKEMR